MAKTTYWYKHIFQKKKEKMTLRKTFSSWWIVQLLEKLCKMRVNIEILNLSQQREEGTFSMWNKLSYDKVFHRTSISNQNEKDWNTYE